MILHLLLELLGWLLQQLSYVVKNENRNPSIENEFWNEEVSGVVEQGNVSVEDDQDDVADTVAIELHNRSLVEDKHLLEWVQTSSIISERKKDEQSGPDEEWKEDSDDAGNSVHADQTSLPVDPDQNNESK